jgi:hypothetical protein
MANGIEVGMERRQVAYDKASLCVEGFAQGSVQEKKHAPLWTNGELDAE